MLLSPPIARHPEVIIRPFRRELRKGTTGYYGASTRPPCRRITSLLDPDVEGISLYQERRPPSFFPHRCPKFELTPSAQGEKHGPAHASPNITSTTSGPRLHRQGPKRHRSPSLICCPIQRPPSFNNCPFCSAIRKTPARSEVEDTTTAPIFTGVATPSLPMASSPSVGSSCAW